ncbi:hypothetical protein GQ42DRAFT_164848 [Ramicandelaber brevisporus]|nr:hypothetical protein GQ42DRAFT_164848 [Ramicandelaber brevisporus]
MYNSEPVPPPVLRDEAQDGVNEQQPEEVTQSLKRTREGDDKTTTSKAEHEHQQQQSPLEPVEHRTRLNSELQFDTYTSTTYDHVEIARLDMRFPAVPVDRSMASRLQTKPLAKLFAPPVPPPTSAKTQAILQKLRNMIDDADGQQDLDKVIRDCLSEMKRQLPYLPHCMVCAHKVMIELRHYVRHRLQRGFGVGLGDGERLEPRRDPWVNKEHLKAEHKHTKEEEKAVLLGDENEVIQLACDPGVRYLLTIVAMWSRCPVVQYLIQAVVSRYIKAAQMKLIEGITPTVQKAGEVKRAISRAMMYRVVIRLNNAEWKRLTFASASYEIGTTLIVVETAVADSFVALITSYSDRDTLLATVPGSKEETAGILALLSHDSKEAADFRDAVNMMLTECGEGTVSDWIEANKVSLVSICSNYLCIWRSKPEDVTRLLPLPTNVNEDSQNDSDWYDKAVKLRRGIISRSHIKAGQADSNTHVRRAATHRLRTLIYDRFHPTARLSMAIGQGFKGSARAKSALDILSDVLPCFYCNEYRSSALCAICHHYTIEPGCSFKVVIKKSDVASAITAAATKTQATVTPDVASDGDDDDDVMDIDQDSFDISTVGSSVSETDNDVDIKMESAADDCEMDIVAEEEEEEEEEDDDDDDEQFSFIGRICSLFNTSSSQPKLSGSYKRCLKCQFTFDRDINAALSIGWIALWQSHELSINHQAGVFVESNAELSPPAFRPQTKWLLGFDDSLLWKNRAAARDKARLGKLIAQRHELYKKALVEKTRNEQAISSVHEMTEIRQSELFAARRANEKETCRNISNDISYLRAKVIRIKKNSQHIDKVIKVLTALDRLIDKQHQDTLGNK